MKNLPWYLMCWTVLVVFFLPAGMGFAQPPERGAFSSPLKGTTIPEENRVRFNASVEINHFNPDQHYWVAIATVTVDEYNWENLLDLYSPQRSASPQMQSLMQGWRLQEFWPKFSVKESPKAGIVHDGGSNPLAGEDPQPMVLLLFKADDQLHKRIKRWFRQGIRTGNYPGFSADILSETLILDRCEIFFF